MNRLPYLADTYWLGDHISPTSFGQVTTSDSQVLVGYPLLTAAFWIGNHFSPTTIVRILKKKLKLKLKEIILKLGTMLIVFRSIFYITYMNYRLHREPQRCLV